jgi:hypothetical protein
LKEERRKMSQPFIFSFPPSLNLTGFRYLMTDSEFRRRYLAKSLQLNKFGDLNKFGHSNKFKIKMSNTTNDQHWSPLKSRMINFGENTVKLTIVREQKDGSKIVTEIPNLSSSLLFYQQL